MIPNALSVPPEDLPKHLRGEYWLRSSNLDGSDVRVSGMRCEATTTNIAVDSHTIVGYLKGKTLMRRRFGSQDISQLVGPGDIAIKDVATKGEWSWRGDALTAIHVYLSAPFIQRVASEMFGPFGGRIRLREYAGTRDDCVLSLLQALAEEGASSRDGRQVMMQALGRQLAVLLIRRHSDQDTPGSVGSGGFGAEQRSRIMQFIEANLTEELFLSTLASEEGLTVDRYSRLFKRTFSCSPHQFVMKMRTVRARDLLSTASMSLADIACETGFADQSHLTRCFKRAFGAPPRQWRNKALAA